MRRNILAVAICSLAVAPVVAMPIGVRTLMMGHAVAQRWIPAMPNDATPEEVGVALADSVDEALGRNITNAVEYCAYRDWALGVKAADGETSAGARAVKASPHAWVSYLLGAEALFENEPTIEIGEISVGSRRTEGGVPCQNGGGLGPGPTMTVSVTVKDGGRVAAVDADKIAAMFEATSDLGDWTGTAKLTPTVTAVTEEDGNGQNGGAMGTSRSARFAVMLGEGSEKGAFLRIRK